MMRRSAVRRVAALFLATTVAIAAPGAVVGHAELKTPSPPADSVQTQPVTEVSGVFTEAMKKDGSSLELLDAAGTSVAKGALDPADDTRMVIDLDAALRAGAYTARWTAVAIDGHVERGEWRFMVAAAPIPSPSPSPTPAPTPAPTASTAPTPSATASPSPTRFPSTAPTPSDAGTGTTGSTSDVLLPIVVALVVLGAGAAYLLRQRSRPSNPA